MRSRSRCVPGRWILLPGMALVLAVGACSPRNHGPTEILWDRWGVPHVHAADAGELFRAFGWAQMRNHANLILRLYGEARGRAAEYWGESHLDSDRYLRTMGVPERAQQWYLAQKPRFKGYLDRFVEGMNAYARRYPESIDSELGAVLPLDPTDVLGHLQRVIHLSFVGREVTFGRAGQPVPGSNGWAIAPSRSAGGNAMLLVNPHLPWSGLFTWFEAQWKTPEVDAYGATLVGMPILGLGFNDHLGWTHTTNPMDGIDLFELTVVEGGYRWDGAVRDFETESQSIRVRQPDGTTRRENLTVRRSVHGPVLEVKDDKAVAVRLVGLDQPHMFEQYWDMIRARSLPEFESALRRLQIPIFNLIYADREGHILYLFGGRTPVRSGGGWQDWQGIVPGNRTDMLWTRTHPYEELPRVVDPSNGWVQNANDPPWSSTLPRLLNPGDFPAYLAPRRLRFRAQRSLRMLKQDPKISFQSLSRYKHSTRMEMADRILDELTAAVSPRSSDLARQAARVLKGWDRQAEAESRGAVLFAEWVRNAGAGIFATPWQVREPLTTPKGLAQPAAAVAALERAARNTIESFGALDVPWGEVYRLRIGERDLPASGGPSRMGIFRSLEFAPEKDGRFRALFGDSFVALVEFSQPVQAKALLSYGNASQPDSRHRGDQLALFARKQLRPVWRTRQEIEANLESREVLSRIPHQ
ncbi:MAG: acylase [Acidobacteriota bacterium]|nr:acylase [Acidobacteriota bacterium]